MMTHASHAAHSGRVIPAQRVVFPVVTPDPEPAAPVPESYAAPDLIGRYLAAMRERAGALTADGRRPVVYLAGGDRFLRRSTAARVRAELDAALHPARLVGYRAVWPTSGPAGTLGRLSPWPGGLPEMAARVDGLVLVLPPSCRTTTAERDEVAAVRAARLPILVRPAYGTLVPLVDCRVTPDGDRLRVELPARRAARSTLAITLAAMGAEVTR
jgi:hypothetical protein